MDVLFDRDLFIFIDVFELVIVVVVYIVIVDNSSKCYFGFVFGKIKVVFKYGYIIFCFELCVVVLGMEIYDVIMDELKVEFC